MYSFYTKKLWVPRHAIVKLLMIMRLTTLILIIAIMQVSASSVAQRITLSEKQASLVTVFDKIRAQTGVDFLVSTSMLRDAKPVNIQVSNVELEEVLKRIFKDQNLDFTIKDKSVVVSKKDVFPIQPVVQTDPIIVQGYVKDENGKPLQGATIQMLNTPLVSHSQENGYFYFGTIPENSTLIFSYIGYKTDTVRVRGRSLLHITMRLNVETIREVIISTGYQTIAKERVTGSFSKPDMKAFHNRTSTTDIMSRLDGLVAGLTVINKPNIETGAMLILENNTNNDRFILRGKGSVNLSSQPLYVVDGVQMPNINNINPNDVEDITVLKDAAAAAIYGAKAANGVIVITTRKGKRNEAVKISYSGFINFQGKPDFKKGLYMSSSQYIQTARELFDPVSYPWSSLTTDFIAPHELILYNQYRGLISETQANRGLDSLSAINNRQQIKDLFYRNAFSTNHTVSASGGADKYSFYSSVSYAKNHTSTLGQTNNAYRVNFNQSIIPSDWLSITLSTSLNNTLDKNKNPINVTDDFLPYQLFKDKDGNNIQMNYLQGWTAETRAGYQARSRLDLNYTPLDEFEKQYSSRNMLSFNNTADIKLKLFKGFRFEGTYGYQKSPGSSYTYSDISEYRMKRELLNFTVANTPEDVPVYYLPITGGKYVTNESLSENWTIRNQLVYNGTLREGRDRLNAQIGQEAQEQSSKTTINTLRGYDDVLKTYALLDYVALSRPLFGAVGSGFSMFNEQPYAIYSAKSRFVSYFALLNYSFSDKYMLDGSIRLDKSSLFATEHSGQKKPTYSIGGKWLISKEAFMNPVNWIDNLGLRTTFGITGNSPYLGAGSMVDVLYADTDPTLGSNLKLASMANKRLRWESTKTLNLGLDFSVLKSKLSGSIDVYNRNTTDLLGLVQYNPLAGGESAIGNIGKIRNNGIELFLRSENIRTRNFSWSSSLVLGYNVNKLVSYSVPEQHELTTLAWLTGNYRVGYSNPSLFAYRFAGLDNMGDPQIKLADGTVTKQRQAARPEDLVYMGTTLPKYNGSVGNTLYYKGISLTANVNYSIGAVMRKPVSYISSGRLTGSAGSYSANIFADFEDRWKNPGDEAFTNLPSYSFNEMDDFTRRDLNYYRMGDLNVISASFVRLKDITLSYGFSSNLLKSLSVGQVNVYVQGTNYMLWKANKSGIDPEYPLLDKAGRSYSVGLNVTF